MNKWLQIPDETKIKAYVQAGEQVGVSAFVVEKDWWVVRTLACIFELEVANHIVFKGGTSLSKAWKLINRFSEDVDLAIDRSFLGYEGTLTKKKITALRKEAGEFAIGSFFNELQTKFKERGLLGVSWEVVGTEASDQDPRILDVYYPNLIKGPGYMEPRVRIEIGCRSLIEPYTIKAISSFLDETYADRDFAHEPIQVPTVNPERTLLEKIFLLHEEFHRPLDKIRVDRLSRHLYDVYHLSSTEFCDTGLTSSHLYSSIVEHRYRFMRVGGVDYNLHQPQTIDPVPIPAVNEAWKADYKKMMEMIHEKDPPSYEELILGLTTLRDRLNALPWRFETQYPNQGR